MMKKGSGTFKILSLLFLLMLVMPLASCAQSAGLCLAKPYADLSEIDDFVNNAQLPFQFPLDEVKSETTPSFTHFCTSSSGPESKRKYHAAEDYFHPAGTPVYAIADGKISFSGPMGGYGWLIIIDHPQANIYSLYGHISPSRWRLESGPVKKGDLIAYLGDSYENGGTREHPLEPHLHLGIRAGQRSDYPGEGEWRWQAGWIKPCPTDVGWLQPSMIIARQEIPLGGFPEPEGNFFSKWGIELLFGSLYVVGGISLFIYATKRNKPILILFNSMVLLAASWFFFRDGWKMSYVILPLALYLLATGIYRLANSKKGREEHYPP